MVLLWAIQMIGNNQGGSTKPRGVAYLFIYKDSYRRGMLGIVCYLLKNSYHNKNVSHIIWMAPFCKCRWNSQPFRPTTGRFRNIYHYNFLMKNIKKGPKRPLIRRTLPLDHQFDMLALKITCYSKWTLL